MGLSPQSPCRHLPTSTGTVPAIVPCTDATRRAATVWVAAALFAATTSPLPALALSKQDVIDIVRESENRMNTKLDTKFNAIDSKFNAIDTKFNAIDTKFEAMNNKIDAQTNKFFWGPVLSTFVAGIGAAYTSNRLEDALEKFSSQKENIKKDIEVDTEEKATKGAILGAAIIIFFMAISGTIVYAATGGFSHTP